MRDAISYRVTDKQRSYLEKFAEKNKLGLCAAARELMNLGIECAEARI